MRPNVCTALLATLFATEVHAAQIGPIALWNGPAPGETATLGPEHDVTTGRDRVAAGKRITRITNVTVPTLTVYLPQPKRRTGAAALVFPGGAYQYVAIDIEGTEIAGWLNSLGLVAVLVKYRVPARAGLPAYVPPLQDAQRAMGMVRARAAEWGIDPARVGAIGFSAGAHLSATLGTHFEKRAYEHVDKADDLSCRPDFALLIYPGSMLAPGSDQLSEELRVTAQTPPSFLVQTEDDSVRVENSLAYYAALKAAKVPAEMHLYPTGGHGYGLRPSADAVSSWPARAQDWLRSLGVLPH
jgi:acetyl esterase/lipase